MARATKKQKVDKKVAAVEKPGDKLTKVLIIGAGGIGFHMATILNRENREREIVIYDDDDFEGGRGHERLPKVSNPKVKKVDFLKGYLRMAMGDDTSRLRVQSERLTPELIEKFNFEHVLVVDATDMAIKPRRELWAALKAKGATMLRVSYDGGMVVISRGLPIVDDDNVGGYTNVPSMAASYTAGGLGAMAVHKLLEGKEVVDQDFSIETWEEK